MVAGQRITTFQLKIIQSIQGHYPLLMGQRQTSLIFLNILT